MIFIGLVPPPSSTSSSNDGSDGYDFPRDSDGEDTDDDDGDIKMNPSSKTGGGYSPPLNLVSALLSPDKTVTEKKKDEILSSDTLPPPQPIQQQTLPLQIVIEQKQPLPLIELSLPLPMPMPLQSQQQVTEKKDQPPKVKNDVEQKSIAQAGVVVKDSTYEQPVRFLSSMNPTNSLSGRKRVRDANGKSIHHGSRKKDRRHKISSSAVF